MGPTTTRLFFPFLPFSHHRLSLSAPPAGRRRRHRSPFPIPTDEAPTEDWIEGMGLSLFPARNLLRIRGIQSSHGSRYGSRVERWHRPWRNPIDFVMFVRKRAKFFCYFSLYLHRGWGWWRLVWSADNDSVVSFHEYSVKTESFVSFF